MLKTMLIINTSCNRKVNVKKDYTPPFKSQKLLMLLKSSLSASGSLISLSCYKIEIISFLKSSAAS